jgi:hypothetical protein
VAAVAIAEQPEPVIAAAAVANGNGRSATSTLQANLWEAAKVVAEAATAPAALIEPTPDPVPVQMATPPAPTPAPITVAPPPLAANGTPVTAVLTPAVPPRPVGPHAAQDPYTNYNIPAFVGSKSVIGKYKWIIFGSTAAFLGVIWAAIWFAGAR